MKAKGRGWMMIRKIAVTRRESGLIDVGLSATDGDRPAGILLTGNREQMLELCRRILEGVHSFRAAILAARIPKPEKAGSDGG